MTLAMSDRSGISKQRGFWLRCFLGQRIVCSMAVLLSWMITSTTTWGQLLELPCKGTAAECSAKFEEYCATNEDTKANLSIPSKMRVWGVLIDPTGALFSHPESGLLVELRDSKTSKVFASGFISEMGTFDLGKVDSGAYRLIVALSVNGKRARFRGWDQPKGLACGLADECTLAVLLRPHGTDQRIDYCPPE